MDRYPPLIQHPPRAPQRPMVTGRGEIIKGGVVRLYQHWIRFPILLQAKRTRYGTNASIGVSGGVSEQSTMKVKDDGPHHEYV